MTSTPRVLMLLDNGFAPDPRVDKEARALAAVGIHSTILAWDWTGGRTLHEVKEGYEIVRIALASGRGKGLRQLGPLASFAARAAVRSLGIDFDVIYVHDLPLLPLGVALSAVTRRPLIYDAHELYWLMEYKKYPSWLTDIMRQIEVVLLRRVSTVLTVSSGLAAHFRRFHPKVVVVGNWYDSSLAERNRLRAEARYAFDIPPGTTCVGAIGALAVERHVDSLIAATALEPHLHVLIAGRGDDEAHLAALASRHPHVHFLGWQDHPATVYAACDALYYGLDLDDRYSKYSSPNTLFRALAQGIPLLTTPIGEGGAVVRAKGCGILLDPLTPRVIAESVRLLQDPAIYAALCERACDAQQEFSWSAASKRLVQTVVDAARERQ